MLPDPLDMIPLKDTTDPTVLGTATDEIRSGVVVENSAGRLVRNLTLLDGTKAILSVSHSESKENKGQVTDRTAIRLEAQRFTSTGVPAVAQSTIIISSPRDGFVLADIVGLVQLLVGTLFLANAGSGDVSVRHTTLERIINGEA